MPIDTTKIQRPKINQGRLIESFEDEDLYIIRENERMNCVKCSKYTYHDIYGTVSGEQIIMVKIITHCRDCGHETEKDPQPIGNMG